MIIARCMVQQNKEKQSIIIVEHYKIHTDKVNYQVGEPIYYEDYLKKGKKNPEG